MVKQYPSVLPKFIKSADCACFFNLIKSRASESSLDLSVSRSGNKGGDHHPSFVQKRLEFLHAGVVDRVFGAVVVAVTPKHAGSRNCDRAAALLRPPLRGAPPSIPQQHGVQHVGCGHKHRRRGTNVTAVMIHDDFVHPGVQELLKIRI